MLGQGSVGGSPRSSSDSHIRLGIAACFDDSTGKRSTPMSCQNSGQCDNGVVCSINVCKARQACKRRREALKCVAVASEDAQAGTASYSRGQLVQAVRRDQELFELHEVAKRFRQRFKTTTMQHELAQLPELADASRNGFERVTVKCKLAKRCELCNAGRHLSDSASRQSQQLERLEAEKLARKYGKGVVL